KLESPPAELVRQVVEARLRPILDTIPGGSDLVPIYPFTDDQVVRVARTEATLRDMLQQCRHLFDHLVYGNDDRPETAPGKADGPKAGPSGEPLDMDSFTTAAQNVKSTVVAETREETLPERGTFSARLGETPARNGSTDHSESGRPAISIESPSELWH